MVLPVGAWSGLELVEPVLEGNRNEVWRATRDGLAFAVRRSRRDEPSLRWELELIESLSLQGFLVPTVLPTDVGNLHDDGVVVQHWVEGHEPHSNAEWQAVATELQRLHAITTNHAQRPGCCVVTSLREDEVSVDADLSLLPGDVRLLVESVFAEFNDVLTAVVHGDPGASNIRITETGQVAFLDWDESRVDVTWHDLTNLGVRVLRRSDHRRAQMLSHAWEAANAWVTEPEYAARRLAQLREVRSS